MKATTWYSEREQCDIVELIITDRDKHFATNSMAILEEVRTIVAREIASKIMEKLNPIIDKALAEVVKP